jgi:hypothetical protein
MKKSIVLLITFALVSTVVFSFFPNSGDSKVITNLGNPGNPIEKTISLEGNVPPLMDATTYIDVPVGNNNVLPNSYFTVSPVNSEDGRYAYNPTVDVGADGDIEWTYDGVGYGEFGHLEQFSDDYYKKTLKYTSPGTNTQTKVKLPTDARIVDARMNIEGRLSTPSFQGTSLQLDTGFDQAQYVATGDIDGDGAADVAVTAPNTISTKPDLVWYKNPSPPGSKDWVKTVVTTKISYAYRVIITDMDNDGDNDILMSTYYTSSSSTGVWWFENKDKSGPGTGDGSQWEGGDSAHRIDASSTVPYPALIDIGDLDNDGDIDVVVAEKRWNYRSVYIFENKDPKNATSWSRTLIYTDSTSWGELGGIAVGEINHDAGTRLDIVFSLQYYQGRIGWLANDGTPFNGAWTMYKIKDTIGTSTYERYPKFVAIGDIDGDSYNDVVCAKDYSYDVYWFKNPSNPKTVSSPWWSKRTVYTNTNYPTDLVVADINSDTDLDVITTTHYQWTNNYNIHYLENVNNGTSWSYRSVDASLAGITGVAVANFDKGADTDIDIVAAGIEAGELKWYENTNIGNPPAFNTRYVDDAGIADPNDVLVMDVDDDGDNDFIVTGAKSGDLQWFERPDDPYDNDWTIYNIDAGLAQAWRMAAGDIDGDGDTDIAATGHVGGWGGNYGEVVWYERPNSNVKGVASWTRHVIDPSANLPSGIDIGDIDGDGDLDIMAAIEYEDAVKFYDNINGDGSSWTTYRVGTAVRNDPSCIELADFDLDNDLDVAVGMGYDWGSNGLIWLENPGNKTITTWPKHTVGKNARSVGDLAVADIDNDGYQDIVITTKRYVRGVSWFENPLPKGNTWTERYITSTTYYGGTNLEIDDIGNDGYLDVIVSSGWKDWSHYGYDTVFWYEEPDEPLQASSWESYTVLSNIEEPRGIFVSDVDGTGLKDIVCLGTGGNEIWWNRVDMSYPRDVQLNVNGVGSVDFTYSGEVSTPRTTQNLALVFKEVLSDAGTPTTTDQYGNEISEIYFEVNSPVVGRVGLNTIDIVYQYDARVERNPHNTYLFNELNEIIPDIGTGTFSVNIAVGSDTPGTLKISNMLVNYNSPPTLEKNLPSDRHVDEGGSANKLYDLHNFFSDDIDNPGELNFRVEQNSESENVWAFITDSRYLKVSANKNPDWSGTFEVMVSATDTMGSKTFSNTFTITVDNTNDPPTIGNPIQNFEIYEGRTTLLVNMDENGYFNDIDSTNLYYRAVVDESFRNYLRVDFDYDNNMYATAIGDHYESSIPVQIYSSDSDISELPLDELEGSEIVQDIFIDILNINDGPMWLNFPAELKLEEDYTFNHGKPYRWLNLNDFTRDVDNKETDLEYSVIHNTNSSYFNVLIDNQDWLHIDNSLVENYVGKSFITIRITDGVLYADVSFWIKTIPINDKPSITILTPGNYDTVSGEVRIAGSAQDIEGLEKVMVRINDGDWQRATGTNNWEFIWITSTDGDYLLSFKAFDNDLVNQKISDVAQLHLKVKNINNDPDGDGFNSDDDKFPYESTQWADTDGDGFGDNSYGYNPDQFPEDPTEWIDTDNDGYGDNLDKFPYDSTQWNDTDEDGYGDNFWGNNADLNSMDSSTGGADSSGQEKSSEGSSAAALWYIIIAIVIANILITYLFNRYYKPSGEK